MGGTLADSLQQQKTTQGARSEFGVNYKKAWIHPAM